MTHFTLSKHDNYIIVEFPEVIYKEEIKDFIEVSQYWVQENTRSVFFDFKRCEKFHNIGFPVIAKFKLQIKKSGIALYSINVSKELTKTIYQGGVEGIFSICEDFKNIQNQLSTKVKVRSILEADSLNILLGGIIPAFNSVFEIEPARGKPFVKSGPLATGIGILGIVSLVEAELIGAVKFYFPDAFLAKLQVEKYNKEMSGISQNVIDVIELYVQIYFSKIQVEMATKGYNLQKNFPSVLIGMLSDLAPSGKEVTMIMPFKCLYGDFWMEISKA
jgi:hypothetical protein